LQESKHALAKTNIGLRFVS